MASEPTYSNLEKGKTYDIQVFDSIAGRIGKVIDKEKGKKDQPGSVLIEFKRPPSYIDKRGVEIKQSPTYTIWVSGDYPIYSYRELVYSTNEDKIEKDMAHSA